MFAAGPKRPFRGLGLEGGGDGVAGGGGGQRLQPGLLLCALGGGRDASEPLSYGAVRTDSSPSSAARPPVLGLGSRPRRPLGPPQAYLKSEG